MERELPGRDRSAGRVESRAAAGFWTSAVFFVPRLEVSWGPESGFLTTTDMGRQKCRFLGQAFLQRLQARVSPGGSPREIPQSGRGQAGLEDSARTKVGG